VRDEARCSSRASSQACGTSMTWSGPGEEAQRLSDALKTLQRLVAGLRRGRLPRPAFPLGHHWWVRPQSSRTTGRGSVTKIGPEIPGCHQTRGGPSCRVLTNDLLTSAKVEASRPNRPNPSTFRLATALASYLDANPRRTGHRLRDLSRASCVAVVDPAHLTRILDKLPGKRLQVRRTSHLHRSGANRRLTSSSGVRDHGPGVPPEFVSRLFTTVRPRCYATTRATQGTGLGLSIVKALGRSQPWQRTSYQRK